MMNAIDRRVVQTNCTWIHTEEWERGGRLRLRRISGRWSGEGKKEGRKSSDYTAYTIYMRRAYYLLDVDRGSRICRERKERLLLSLII